MVQLTERAMRLTTTSELAISSLRPTIYRPSRPTRRITTQDRHEGDNPRRPAARPATPERGNGTVEPS